ncbi:MULTISPECIES: hypothetical protein [unclassified Carboxylicivirga]|uniref:hypothetical protein n=1 Tax=Carboxylicivirga TaxID=1628153 RepID=UPI003D349976
MKNTCKICWTILTLFLLGNIILLGIWWLKTDAEPNVQKKNYDKEEHRMRMHRHLLKNAEINEAQFDEMYGLWKQHARRIRSHESAIDSLRKRLMNETFNNNSDSVEAGRLIDQISRQQKLIEKSNYYHFRQLRGVCENDRQRELLDQMFKERIMREGPKRRFRGRRHRH